MVILDEPCSGVDIRARKNIWDLISVLRKGRAVALATHYLDEAEHLSDSILVMNEVSSGNFAICKTQKFSYFNIFSFIAIK